jgi:hypothetical protein
MYIVHILCNVDVVIVPFKHYHHYDFIINKITIFNNVVNMYKQHCKNKFDNMFKEITFSARLRK